LRQSPTNNIRDDFDSFEEEKKKLLQERIKGYEPYDLKEIDIIIKKAEKKARNLRNLDKKFSYLSLELDRVNFIIENSEKVFKIREENGLNDFPEDYWDKLDQAKISRENFYLEIKELSLAKLNETDILLESNAEKNIKESDVKTSIQEPQSFSDTMTLKEAAQHIRKSESFIYHNKDKYMIPYHKVGKNLIFKKQELDDWIITDKEKMGTVDKTINKCNFIFIERPLEILANAFVKKGYIDNDNALLMKDCFSITPTLIGKEICWKMDLKSLMTFIYLSDRLDFIDKDKTERSNFRIHDTSAKEEKEKEDKKLGNKEVKYSILLKNFIISKVYGTSKAEYSREWKEINEAITTLREEIARKKDPKIDEADIIENMTRKEAILFYFKNKEQKAFKKNNKIDREILDLFYETWQSLQK